jgi:hypothetical protein
VYFTAACVLFICNGNLFRDETEKGGPVDSANYVPDAKISQVARSRN